MKLIKIKNKKSMLFSLFTALLVFILFISFKNKSEVENIDRDAYVSRAQMLAMDHFVDDFENQYIRQILRTASKQALINMTRKSSPFTKKQLGDVMEDGNLASVNLMDGIFSTDENFRQSLGTFAFTLSNESARFNYELLKARQANYETILLDFSVTYSFKIEDGIWYKLNDPVTVPVSVYNLWHPAYSDYIFESWSKDESGCYITKIISDAEPCTVNIKPPEALE